MNTQLHSTTRGYPRETSGLRDKNKKSCSITIKERNKKVTDNLKLVKVIANNYRLKSKHQFDDLYQVGCIGLIKAVENFDPSKGFKFSTYAYPMISGEISHYIRDKTSPFSGFGSLTRKYKNLSNDDKAVYKNLLNPISLSTKIKNDIGGFSETTLENILVASQGNQESIFNVTIEEIISWVKENCSSKDYQIFIEGFIYKTKSQQTLADTYQTTLTYISNTQTRTLKKIRVRFTHH
jgi:RNA polymerase sigma factor (sigma-70 family)